MNQPRSADAAGSDPTVPGIAATGDTDVGEGDPTPTGPGSAAPDGVAQARIDGPETNHQAGMIPAGAAHAGQGAKLQARRRLRPSPAVPAAAAAIAVMLAIAALVLMRSRPATPTSANAGAPAPNAPTVAGAGGAAVTSTTLSVSRQVRNAWRATDMGTLDGDAAIRRAVRAAADDPQNGDPSDQQMEDLTRCLKIVRDDQRRLYTLAFAATATVDDLRVFVMVFDEAGNGRDKAPQRIVVLRQDECRVVAELQL